jgi:hypothetical protein
MDFGLPLLPLPAQSEGERNMHLGKIIRLGVVAMLAVGATASGASAYIICNHEGDCWHSDRRESAPGQTFEYHSDDWYFHQEWGTHHRFREYHEGRGYWHNGVWVQL